MTGNTISGAGVGVVFLCDEKDTPCLKNPLGGWVHHNTFKTDKGVIVAHGFPSIGGGNDFTATRVGLINESPHTYPSAGTSNKVEALGNKWRIDTPSLRDAVSYVQEEICLGVI